MDRITKKFIEALNVDLSDPNPMNLAEAPIDTLQTIGNWDKGSSFTHKTDRAILTNPSAVQKIKDKFANTEVHWDMYFVNSKEGRIHKEIGEVQEDFIRNELKLDTPINRNNITVFYTNNTGDQGKMMTAWIIAHRFGHVIRRLPGWNLLSNEVNEMVHRVLEDAYGRKMVLNKKNGTLGEFSGSTDEKILKNFAQLVGTFKSARDKKIRNYYEFHYELLAQFITTGEVKFNPLPQYIPVRYAWGKPTEGLRFTGNEVDKDYYDDYLPSFGEHSYPDYANSCLHECVGKIFVM